MNMDWFSVLGADRLIDSIESFLRTNALIPSSLGSLTVLCVAIAIFSLGIGFLFRLIFGNHCAANRVVSGFIGILFVYATTVAVFRFEPWGLEQYLSPLPFTIFRRDILIISVSMCPTLSELSSHLLSLIILAFIIQFLNFILPDGRSLFIWLLLKVLSVAAAIFLHLAANWALNTFLPGVIAAYAPIVLLAVLIVTLAISLFNPLLCVLFTVVNPVVGVLYTFFFSNVVGKHLTRAVFSAALICGLFRAMEYFDFGVIDITGPALLTYCPFAIFFMGLWYIFDSKL